MMATTLATMHRDRKPVTQDDGKKDNQALTQSDAELTLKDNLVQRRFDPFLLQAILIKVERKGLKSQFLHRRRVDKFYRRLHARYSDDEVDEPRVLGFANVVQEITRANFSRCGNIELLAKRISSLRGNMALMQRKSASNVLEEESHSRKSHSSITNLMAAQMARHRWQVAIGLVMGMAKMAAHTIQDKKEPFAVGDLVFEPTLFRANQNEFVLAADSKFVLTQIPEKRTQEQVEDVAQNLRCMGIKSFNEYPTSIQRKIVQIARYEVLTPLRVIIRQGRPAEHFFFLIDGAVVVIERTRSVEKEDKESEELIILRKGAMFGEIEMVNRLNRRATVITKENVELLTIERNDLLKIFEDRQSLDQIPEHIQFLRQCHFIKLWPTENLINDLDLCTPYFFKQNVLIVEDSVKNDFLVVIRSGQCRVIRKLYIKRLLLKQKQGLKTKSAMRAINNKLLRNNFHSFSRPGSQFNHLFGVDLFEQNLRVSADIDQIMDEKRLHRPSRLGEKSKSRLESRLSYHLSRHDSNTKKGIHLEDLDTTDDQAKQKNKFIGIGSAPKTRLEKALLLPATQEYMVIENERDTDNTMVPIYVQVDVLNRNDVFGLDTLVFDRFYDRPSSTGLLLLSGENEKGVDVVLLSKSYFIEHASEEVQWRVRQMMKSYPSSKTLEEEIEQQKLLENCEQDGIETVIKRQQLFRKKFPWK